MLVYIPRLFWEWMAMRKLLAGRSTSSESTFRADLRKSAQNCIDLCTSTQIGVNWRTYA